MIAYLILDLPYTHVENTYCVAENHIQDYMFLQEAKAACSNDSECTMIFDNLWAHFWAKNSPKNQTGLSGIMTHLLQNQRTTYNYKVKNLSKLHIC